MFDNSLKCVIILLYGHFIIIVLQQCIGYSRHVVISVSQPGKSPTFSRFINACIHTMQYTHINTVCVCVLAAGLRRWCGTHSAGGPTRRSEVRRWAAESARRTERTHEDLRQGTQTPHKLFVKNLNTKTLIPTEVFWNNEKIYLKWPRMVSLQTFLLHKYAN